MSNAQDPYRRDELKAREAKARAMGGPKRVAIQRSKGRQTVRERIDLLLDPGTFEEMQLLAHSDLPEAAERSAADGKPCGYGQINGRTVFVSGDDPTIFAGAGGRVGSRKMFEGMSYAYEKGFPVIHLGDAGGARVPDIMGSDGMMSMVYPVQGKPRRRRVPQITAIMGECYGGPGWTAAVSDIIVQVKGAIMAVGGPSILSVATGEQATPEQLGGWERHAYVTGQVDLFAEDEADCLRLIRQVLSYFPSSAAALPPRARLPASTDLCGRLTTVVPADSKQIYDMHDVLTLLFDEDSVLELKPFYDGSLITALARLDGYSVGVLANNPLVTAGAMGPGACEKAAAFIALCDSFHIPLVFLHDTPGFLIGDDAEQKQMPLKIMRFIEALQQSSVPRVSLIIRKSYGMAHCNMSGGNMGNDFLFAWPIAEVSFVAPEVAVSIVYGRKLADAEDTAAAFAAYKEELGRANAPWAAAGAGYIDRIINPDESRSVLINALARARGSDGQRGRSQRYLANWPRM